MRLTDQAIRAVAPVLRPLLFDAISTRGVITDDDLRSAIVAARRAGLDVPNLGSARSLALVEATIVDM